MLPFDPLTLEHTDTTFSKSLRHAENQAGIARDRKGQKWLPKSTEKKMCIEHVFFVNSFFFSRKSKFFSKSSKLAETFQKDAPGDTDHGEPLCGQKY